MSKTKEPTTIFRAAATFQPALRELGIDGESVFEHSLIQPWRVLRDRENCILQATLEDGSAIYWHVKRYKAANHASTPMDREVAGHEALEAAEIPTAQLVAWGKLTDRRSFVIFNDLTGYQPLDKMLAAGESFDSLIQPTATLSARLHNAGLHHRDFYLCHFMGRHQENNWDLHLIDVARVKHLPKLFAQRWIIKDVAQFIYSTHSLPITASQREQWLHAYGAARGVALTDSFRQKVSIKQKWIARHDASLRKQQPNRNISLPAT